MGTPSSGWKQRTAMPRTTATTSPMRRSRLRKSLRVRRARQTRCRRRARFREASPRQSRCLSCPCPSRPTCGADRATTACAEGRGLACTARHCARAWSMGRSGRSGTSWRQCPRLRCASRRLRCARSLIRSRAYGSGVSAGSSWTTWTRSGSSRWTVATSPAATLATPARGASATSGGTCGRCGSSRSASTPRGGPGGWSTCTAPRARTAGRPPRWRTCSSTHPRCAAWRRRSIGFACCAHGLGPGGTHSTTSWWLCAWNRARPSSTRSPGIVGASRITARGGSTPSEGLACLAWWCTASRR
mmetsp:Transcript_48648/g.139851  ORF Transcript_48648/g.139851 Transcript_48648/m.139851 type:complete len:302 (-) Transcript_48648:35-940(-)